MLVLCCVCVGIYYHLWKGQFFVVYVWVYIIIFGKGSSLLCMCGYILSPLERAGVFGFCRVITRLGLCLGMYRLEISVRFPGE